MKSEVTAGAGRASSVARAAAVGAVLLGLAAVAGCGGGRGPAKTTSTTPPATTAPTSKTGAEPPKKAAGAPAVVTAGVPFPTNIAFDRHGGLWVTSGTNGQNASDGVWYVPSGGRARHVVTGLRTALGLAWVGNRLYVAHKTSPSNGRITSFGGFDGTHFTSRHVALDGLKVGSHSVSSIVQGPDGRLYVGVGAPNDSTGPPGRVLSFSPSGGRPVVEATGLRGAFGLAFYGRRLLVTETSRDDIGSGPPDELDSFEPSGPVVNFGFPACYGQGGAACAGTRAPLVSLAPHSSPAGVAVKRDVAFVAENGAAVVQTAIGNDILRIDLRTGKHDVFWHSPVKYGPLGAVIGPNGDLYVTLFASGKVVRFAI